jgi:hypothetical protein
MIAKNTISGLFVCIVVALVATYYYGLTNSENWKAPPHYGSGDAVFGATLLEGAASGELKPFKTYDKKSLSAPYQANYSDFPFVTALEMQPGGWLINALGIAVGANLYLIFSHITAALSMFICLRFMKCSSLWALVFGISFGLSPYLFTRNFSHITLVNTAYLIPLCCVVLWFLFLNNPAKTKSKKLFLVVFFSFFMGTQNPYYSAPYFWALFIAIAFWWLNSSFLKVTIFYSAIIAGFVVGLLLGFRPTLFYALEEGKNFEAVTRYYGDLQKLALRPVEMFLPGSGSEIPLLKQLSAFYENQCEFRKNFEFCESMASYLGLVGVLGFLLLFGITTFFILSRQQNKIPGWFWFVLFLIAFAVVGGLNGIIGLGKFYYLRSANRYSIYITAICLIYLGIFLSSKPLYQKKWLMWLVATALLLTAIFEPILPRLQGIPYHPAAVAKFESDQKFAIALEDHLPEEAMVFNFPVIEFPERGTYAHFRPTLFTDKVRYSFGALTGRSRETWQSDVEMLPFSQMVQKLREYGFSGILIYKGEDLSDEHKVVANKASDFFKQNQFSRINSPDGDFEFFAFDPNRKPVFPPVRPMYVNNWWGVEVQPAGLIIDRVEGAPGWRWATHLSAMVEVFNEQTDSRRLSLRGGVLGATQSDLQIYVDRKMVFSGKISPNTPIEFSTESIEVAGHKAVRFEFRTDQKPTVREGRKFSFAVGDLEAIWEKK